MSSQYTLAGPRIVFYRSDSTQIALWIGPLLPPFSAKIQGLLSAISVLHRIVAFVHNLISRRLHPEPVAPALVFNAKFNYPVNLFYSLLIVRHPDQASFQSILISIPPEISGEMSALIDSLHPQILIGGVLGEETQSFLFTCRRNLGYTVNLGGICVGLSRLTHSRRTSWNERQQNYQRDKNNED